MADDRSAESKDRDLMTLSQAASFLRVRPTDLMGAARSGSVPYHQGEDGLRFSRAELFQRMHNPGRNDLPRPGHGEGP